MNDTKRTQMPSLYDDLTPQSVLKILHKNKNDYVSRKTVWAVAAFSFCVGSLAALLAFWMFFYSPEKVLNQSLEMDGTALSHQSVPLTDKSLPAASPVTTNALPSVISNKTSDSHPQSGNAKNAVLLTADKPENNNIASNSVTASSKPARDQSTHRESSGVKTPTASNPFKSLESGAAEPVKLKSNTNTTKPVKAKSSSSAAKSTKAKAKSKADVTKSAKTKSTSAVKKSQVQNKTSPKKIPDKKNSQPDQIEQLIMQLNKANDKKNSVQKAVSSAHLNKTNSKSSKPF